MAAESPAGGGAEDPAAAAKCENYYAAQITVRTTCGYCIINNHSVPSIPDPRRPRASAAATRGCCLDSCFTV